MVYFRYNHFRFRFVSVSASFPVSVSVPLTDSIYFREWQFPFPLTETALDSIVSFWSLWRRRTSFRVPIFLYLIHASGMLVEKDCQEASCLTSAFLQISLKFLHLLGFWGLQNPFFPSECVWSISQNVWMKIDPFSANLQSLRPKKSNK